MRVRKSAMGSVTSELPAGLGHARDEALVGELAQADPAQAELAVHGTRPAAAAAARVLPGLVLGTACLAHALGRLRHQAASSRVVAYFGRPSRANGMPSASRRANASPSVWADVTIVTSRPRTWSMAS